MSLDDTEQRTTRQRAIVACSFCRQRKRRCNGERPVCSNCEAANAQCCYIDVEQRRLDVVTSLSVIGERLDQLEATLGEHSNALNQLKSRSAEVSTLVSHFSQNANGSSVDLLRESPNGSELSYTTIPSGTPNVAMDISPDVALPPMTIPLWHSTTTGSLLSCPQVKSLLGDYPSDVFLRIEERRALPRGLKLPCIPGSFPEMPTLDRTVTDALMEYYFQSVNMQHPILDYDECLTQYHVMASDALQPSLESALILVMLALANAARTEPTETLEAEWSPGASYFLPALSISMDAYLNTPNIPTHLPQCLYLAALYYNYLARPLDSWKLVHMASTSFQRQWISSKPWLEMNEAQYQPLIRLCWAIFSLECDLIAEHHLPRSGVETIVDSLQFPLCGYPPNSSLLAWLAELSARRLLNRVHHVMYADDQKYLLQSNYTSTQAGGNEEDAIERLLNPTLKISAELDGQLNNWYDLIPQTIKPDLAQAPTEVQEALMVLRYHSAKDIIFRPFLLFACSLPATLRPPQSLIERCQTAIYSCRQYILVAAIRLREPSASTEIVIHSVFASTVIVTIAALNLWLKQYVPDINSLQALAISTIQRWAFDSSCIQAMALMLGAIQNKTKMLRASLDKMHQ
ncbi:hypothetical protein BDW59DRAFT_175071 [Aspergillus cavernicola]|uniref:Zn(2)-C6 fungal-type domain-containing protein n=1 Tax=Aspergillus cavernicola TaxID=176166 RepID=A0ABR4HT96_9EURO